MEQAGIQLHSRIMTKLSFAKSGAGFSTVNVVHRVSTKHLTVKAPTGWATCFYANCSGLVMFNNINESKQTDCDMCAF